MISFRILPVHSSIILFHLHKLNTLKKNHEHLLGLEVTHPVIDCQTRFPRHNPDMSR
jgi:hypothetical protein